MTTPSVILLMGVSGAGKTTVGRLLADVLGWSFQDAGHFMHRDLVGSQFDLLEEPDRGLVVDASESPDRIVARIRSDVVL